MEMPTASRKDHSGDVLSPPPFELATETNIGDLGDPVTFIDSNHEPYRLAFKPVAVELRHVTPDKSIRYLRPRLYFQLAACEGAGRVMTGEDGKPLYCFYRPEQLSGLAVMELADKTQALRFHYYKQESGEENFARVVVPTGFAYGLHPGHTGVPARSIQPENSGWYIVGTQVGMLWDNGTLQGSFNEQVPGERAFPLSRIIDGPLGDPRNRTHRRIWGIY